ncbi:hypothetical protein TNCV_72211 [Trichonephila clavipes]|nr:hypothetical protein TNCV_72211 [Trichonephila clavipes]
MIYYKTIRRVLFYNKSSKAIGDGPRSFEPRSGDEEDNKLVLPLQTTTQHQWEDQVSTDLTCSGLSTRFFFSGIGLELKADDHVFVTITTRVPRPPSYARAIGDGPRNFEPWSNDEDDT